MKHLTTILAVFLLMGCQTTNSTPKDTASPAKVENTQVEEKKKEKETPDLVEPKQAFQTMKPVLCADIESVHKGLRTGSNESPFIVWEDATNHYTGMLWMNSETKTITVIEYAGTNVGCFTSVGINAHINKEYELKAKGRPISFKKGLD